MLKNCRLWKDARFVLEKPLEDFEVIETYENGSHLLRALIKCRECGQLYFYECYEEIDWGDGDDAQYCTWIPVESENDTKEMHDTSQVSLMAFTPRLNLDDPTGAELVKVYWVGAENDASRIESKIRQDSGGNPHLKDKKLPTDGSSTRHKSRRKAELKMLRMGYSSTNQLTDIVRGGFSVETLQVSEDVIKHLRFEPQFEEFVDLGWNHNPSGFVDRIVLARFTDGMISEIHFWPTGLLDIKLSKGMELYHRARDPEGSTTELTRLHQKEQEFLRLLDSIKLPKGVELHHQARDPEGSTPELTTLHQKEQELYSTALTSEWMDLE